LNAVRTSKPKWGKANGPGIKRKTEKRVATEGMGKENELGKRRFSR